MNDTIQQSDYPVQVKPVPTFYFIGVTTKKSSIMRVFPEWMKVLGRSEVLIEGMDLPIHADPEIYRAAVAQLKYDPNSLGGLVTTHKIDLYHAAHDMFEYFDPYALTCGEISSISKLDGRLEGHAKDPITAGLSLDAIIDKNYFGRTGAYLLCFGAGGSALATLLHLMDKPDKDDRPSHAIFVNRSPGRLETMRSMVEQHGTDIDIEYVCTSDPQEGDRLMKRLSDFSIVINATGMGKDTPGSPITNAGVFPYRGIAWEFNYRGELDFMHQALAQVESRRLIVEDGWVYFLHGWTQVIAQVLHIDLSPALFQQLADAAQAVR
jgi:shikimate dehydrogenase